ncbi:MAG: hypothetical protein HQ557_00990 [Bacteroidetes bacterium]|nr:hypothetical protein [Bacteroidota bacterium]
MLMAMQKQVKFESIDVFIPPFCPYKDCKNHNPDIHLSQNFTIWYNKVGTYKLKSGIRRQRYGCKSCDRSFSQNQFSLHFYQRIKFNFTRLQELLVRSTSIRGMAAILHCSPATILHKIAILSRQSIAIQTLLLHTAKLSEPLVADGFESYAFSKYSPHDIHILVGKISQLCFFYNVAPFKRKGRKTAKQQQRCEELYKTAKFPRGSITNKFLELADQMNGLHSRSGAVNPLLLYTDYKTQYVTALHRHTTLRKLTNIGDFSHIQISSHKLRDLRNELFAVNYFERELRKDLSEFHRKSVCFARDLCCQMYRISIYMCWHNIFKSYRINSRAADFLSHAEMAGIESELLDQCKKWMSEDRRFFLSHIPQIPETWRSIWCGEIVTPLKNLSLGRVCGSYIANYVVA